MLCSWKRRRPGGTPDVNVLTFTTFTVLVASIRAIGVLLGDRRSITGLAWSYSPHSSSFRVLLACEAPKTDCVLKWAALLVLSGGVLELNQFLTQVLGAEMRC